MALIFCRQISWIIFNNDQYTPLVMITAGTLGLYSFNLLLINILNGYKGYRKYIILNIISSILILIFSIFLVVPFGLYGALVNCIVSQTIVILVTLFMVRHEAWFYSLFSRGKIERKVVKKMMGFSLMAITSAILGPLAQISVRKYIAECISLDMAGIWEE
ncbi:MAG: polysaccharide biosynthesis C-terminal domain-containing protein [Chitinophagaceae bacterium]|nr:polysaccharide biosynthesis C-terminal domain-containing protein [Chitinophagaceae bacterium]